MVTEAKEALAKKNERERNALPFFFSEQGRSGWNLLGRSTEL